VGRDIILVVEDDRGLNNLIQKALQELGYSTEGAFTGKEAVTKVMTNGVKLMLLDYRLQDMSGKQVVEALAAEGYRVPFIVVTGFGDEKIAVEMLKLGARDYIIKDEGLIDILPYRIEKTLKEISHEKIVETVDRVLEESETKLKSILAASPTGIGLLRDRVFSWVSGKVLEMTGYSDGELLGKSIRMLYESDEEYERAGRDLYDNLTEAGEGETDTQWRRKDGSKIDVYIHITPLKSDNLDAGIIFSALDITERKKSERELFESKRDWEEVFNSVTDMITVHDKDFNIIRANKAAEKILGLPIFNDLKAKCFQYYHGTSCAPEGCPSCECLKTGKPATFEVFEPHLNKYIEIRSMPRFNNDNELIGLIHVVRDLTERKKAEEELEKREFFLSNVFSSIQDGISILDKDMNIVRVNKTMEQCTHTRCRLPAKNVLRHITAEMNHVTFVL
jgi:PAS domain S-box-containing protein